MWFLLLTILIAFGVSAFFGWSMHWALHQKFTGRFNTAHIEHHMALYPPEDYQSEVYRETTKNGAPAFFLLTGSPLIAIPFAMWCFGVLSWYLMLTALIIGGIYGFLSNYLHDAFHVRNHWLNYVPVIKKAFHHWTMLHWIHHLTMKHNLGIFVMFFDRLFGTFQDTTEKPNNE